MAQNHTPAPVSNEDLTRARDNWAGFVTMIKYSLIAIIVVLIGMAAFLT